MSKQESLKSENIPQSLLLIPENLAKLEDPTLSKKRAPRSITTNRSIITKRKDGKK
jgi:hypothetical protein